ncbi:MAG TPA: hypothetical protein VK623_06255, partial [Flavobacterium sp.]|nr:hypothetical protein [Flavobacterium sp.]
MKKLLLSIFIVSSFAANAQFWTQKAAGFATASRGINCISIVDANVIWAKAYDGSATANPSIREYTKSTDGGNTWTAGTINPFGILGGVGSITAASATTAWITTYPVTATVQNHNAIWVTTNGGTTWTKQTTAAFAADSFANFVHFWDANNGVAMGDPQSGYFEIYTTSNGGTTWTRVLPANIPTPSPVGAEYGYTNNFYVAGNSIWFGTSSGRLFKSTDMGATWAASQAPIADFGGTDASEITGSYAFSDNNKGLLVKSDGTLYNTIDGGT